MLDAGSVIYIEVCFRQGSRNKYLVVLDVDDQVHTLAINSSINPYFGQGPFRDCYVQIDHTLHPFLSRDSFVDCNDVIRLPLAGVVAEMRRAPDCIRGRLSPEAIKSVVDAIRQTPGLSPFQKDRYCESLTDP